MDKMVRNKQDNLNENYLVVKGNILNDAKFCGKITLVEYRLLLIALSKISPLMQRLEYVYFTAKDFCKLLNIKEKGMYSHIREASKKLASRTITLEDKFKKDGITFSWLHEIKYSEALIRIKFHPNLENHILKIRKDGGYTKYYIKNILKLKSIYTVRIYELLKQYQKLGRRTISLNELREKIGAIGKSHKKMNFFRKYVFIPSQNEINVCTDIIFDYEEVKEGKQVMDIIFYIQSKLDVSDDYKILKKDKLILLIQHEIHNRTGFIFEARHMNNLHRNILLDLMAKFQSGVFNKIFIRSPESFFIYQLSEIHKKYDIELLNIKFEDY